MPRLRNTPELKQARNRVSSIAGYYKDYKKRATGGLARSMSANGDTIATARSNDFIRAHKQEIWNYRTAFTRQLLAEYPELCRRGAQPAPAEAQDPGQAQAPAQEQQNGNGRAGDPVRQNVPEVAAGENPIDGQIVGPANNEADNGQEHPAGGEGQPPAQQENNDQQPPQAQNEENAPAQENNGQQIVIPEAPPLPRANWDAWGEMLRQAPALSDADIKVNSNLWRLENMDLNRMFLGDTRTMLRDYFRITTPDPHGEENLANLDRRQQTGSLGRKLDKLDDRMEADADPRNADPQHADPMNTGLSNEQQSGLSDIAKYLYQHCAGRKSRNNVIFVEGILRRSARERLLIYYLVEKGKYNGTSDDDILASQGYTPTVAGFKKAVKRSGFNLMGRMFMGNIHWSYISKAVEIAIEYRPKLKFLAGTNSMLDMSRNGVHLNALGLANQLVTGAMPIGYLLGWDPVAEHLEPEVHEDLGVHVGAVMRDDDFDEQHNEPGIYSLLEAEESREEEVNRSALGGGLGVRREQAQAHRFGLDMSQEHQPQRRDVEGLRRRPQLADVDEAPEERARRRKEEARGGIPVPPPMPGPNWQNQAGGMRENEDLDISLILPGDGEVKSEDWNKAKPLPKGGEDAKGFDDLDMSAIDMAEDVGEDKDDAVQRLAIFGPENNKDPNFKPPRKNWQPAHRGAMDQTMDEGNLQLSHVEGRRGDRSIAGINANNNRPRLDRPPVQAQPRINPQVTATLYRYTQKRAMSLKIAWKFGTAYVSAIKDMTAGGRQLTEEDQNNLNTLGAAFKQMLGLMLDFDNGIVGLYNEHPELRALGGDHHDLRQYDADVIRSTSDQPSMPKTTVGQDKYAYHSGNVGDVITWSTVDMLSLDGATLVDKARNIGAILNGDNWTGMENWNLNNPDFSKNSSAVMQQPWEWRVSGIFPTIESIGNGVFSTLAGIAGLFTLYNGIKGFSAFTQGTNWEAGMYFFKQIKTLLVVAKNAMDDVGVWAKLFGGVTVDTLAKISTAGGIMGSVAGGINLALGIEMADRGWREGRRLSKIQNWVNSKTEAAGAEGASEEQKREGRIIGAAAAAAKRKAAHDKHQGATGIVGGVVSLAGGVLSMSVAGAPLGAALVLLGGGISFVSTIVGYARSKWRRRKVIDDYIDMDNLVRTVREEDPNMRVKDSDLRSYIREEAAGLMGFTNEKAFFNYIAKRIGTAIIQGTKKHVAALTPRERLAVSFNPKQHLNSNNQHVKELANYIMMIKSFGPHVRMNADGTFTPTEAAMAKAVATV